MSLVDTARYENHSIELVATDATGVLGVLDVAIVGQLATIETIAVHPDRARCGLGTALLDAALRQMPLGATTLDAWTREDAAANAWYRRAGFEETYRYLHVYAGGSELGARR